MSLAKIMEFGKSALGKKLILPLLILVGMLLIAFGNFWGSSNKAKPAEASVANSQDSEAQYVSDLEGKLEGVLSQINGAGEVSVMITLADSGQSVVATNDQSSQSTTDTSSSVNKNSTIVTSNNQPVIVQELKPKIEGVVVVASGASNANVSMQIARATVALTGVGLSKVVVVEKSKLNDK